MTKGKRKETVSKKLSDPINRFKRLMRKIGK
jgi:hypothetical protein